MSQTPRTDAELIRMADAGCPHIVHGDFARDLERELAEVTAEREAMTLAEFVNAQGWP